MEPLALVLTIVTLNVYQSFTEPKERYAAIATELGTLDPDIATFQEVARRGATSSVDTLLPGFHRVVDGRPGGYVQAILSRHPIVRQVAVPFRNNRARMALGAVIAVPLGARTREVLVLTTHLDYQLDHHAERRAQLRAIFDEAARFDGPVIVTGDLNFGDGEPESDAIPPTFVDTFRALHPDDPGFTWDRDANGMARAGSLRGEGSRRLDRILTSGLTPKTAQRVFEKAIRGGLWPSDHFGVFSRLLIR